MYILHEKVRKIMLEMFLRSRLNCARKIRRRLLKKGEMGAQEEVSYEKENSCNIIDIDVTGIACNRLR